MSSPAVQSPSPLSSASVSSLTPAYNNEGGLDELVKRMGTSMAHSAYAGNFEWFRYTTKNDAEFPKL